MKNKKPLGDIKNFIWDFDGTLFDTYPYTINCFCEAVEKVNGKRPEFLEIYKYMMQTIGHAFAAYKQLLGDEKDAEIRDAYRSIRIPGPETEGDPFPYAKELLEFICDSGKANYMFTHRVNDVYPFMDHWDMRKYFTRIVTLADGVKSKPSPDAIYLLINEYGLDPAETVMIGDREIDVLSGKNAGVLSCHVTNGLPYDDFETDYRVESLKDIYEALGGKV